MKGFTLIELMIVIAIIGIIAAVLIRANSSDYTCTAGYKFTYKGHQIMDSQGKGIPCGSESTGGK